MNFQTPTPIQQQAIPAVIQGNDILGIAQTGTGKTAAFVLPVLHRILEMPKTGKIQALIVVPTRELALQIDQAIEGYSYFTGVSSIAIYGGGGGEDFAREAQAMKGGIEIAIATPGRLISHMHVGNADFSSLRFLVLDEADRMLDMGFQPDLFRIMRALNEDRQTLMFSATMPKEIEQLARTFLKDPVQIRIAISKPAAGVKQGAFVVYEAQKQPLILQMLTDPERADQSIIVFCSRKQSVSELYQHLKRSKLNVQRISSDLEQDERETVMQDFRSRQVKILVATDVISRGIDIDNIDMVINYDVPVDAEDYVHRVGRTARAQKKGEAITIVSPQDQRNFHKIESLIEMDIEKLPVPESLGATPEYNPAKSNGGKGRSSKSGGKGGGKKRFFKKKGGGSKGTSTQG